MKFLDNTGLARLWNIIKNGFLALTGGTITGNVIVSGVCRVGTLHATSITNGSVAKNQVFATNGEILDMPNGSIIIPDAIVSSDSTLMRLAQMSGSIQTSLLGAGISSFLENYRGAVDAGNGYLGVAYGRLFSVSATNPTSVLMYRVYLPNFAIPNGTDTPYYAIVEFISTIDNSHVYPRFGYKLRTAGGTSGILIPLHGLLPSSSLS